MSVSPKPGRLKQEGLDYRRIHQHNSGPRVVKHNPNQKQPPNQINLEAKCHPWPGWAIWEAGQDRHSCNPSPCEAAAGILKAPRQPGLQGKFLSQKIKPGLWNVLPRLCDRACVCEFASQFSVLASTQKPMTDLHTQQLQARPESLECGAGLMTPRTTVFLPIHSSCAHRPTLSESCFWGLWSGQILSCRGRAIHHSQPGSSLCG